MADIKFNGIFFCLNKYFESDDFKLTENKICYRKLKRGDFNNEGSWRFYSPNPNFIGAIIQRSITLIFFLDFLTIIFQDFFS